METLKEASQEILAKARASLKKPKIVYPKGIKTIYDSGNSVPDRYTVYYSNPQDWGIIAPGRYEYLGMSALPFHPQGIAQHGVGRLGKHNGKRIRFEDLPEDCQKCVKQDLES